LFLSAAALAFLKRWSKRMRRIPLKVHRRVAYAAIILAAIHLVFALSIYV
jgi:DMSO/TMAO reductase YedYZ heme-binding membrane subunit